MGVGQVAERLPSMQLWAQPPAPYKPDMTVHVYNAVCRRWRRETQRSTAVEGCPLRGWFESNLGYTRRELSINKYQINT